MLIKRASIKSMPIEALNSPTGKDWDLFNLSRLKVAAIDKTKKTDLGGFDLSAALKDHPNHLFVKAFAIKENEVNDNGDAFSPEELKKAAHTFIGCPVFVNHQNDDVEKARGKVVHAWYDADAGGIFVINMVDKEAYPPLARGIEEGYIVGTSMGAQVTYSCCSACHNKASTKDEFCDHIKNRKNKKISRTIECAYHESPSKPTDDCPVCNCKKGSTKEHTLKEAQIFEWNYGIKFIEDSFVVSPACHDCLVCDILNVPKIEASISESLGKMRKLASSLEEALSNGKMSKTAGMKEVSALNDAMNLIEGVARSMMAQKQVVSMEYVSDLVEQLSKLQETTDELIEMGYSQIPSPPQADAMIGSHQAASPGGQGAQQMSPNAMLSQQQPTQSFSAPSGGQVSTSPIGGGVATVTKPSFSLQEKEFEKIAANMYDSVQKICGGCRIVENIMSPTRSQSVANISDSYTVSNGEFRVVIAKAESGDVHVAEFQGDKLLQMSAASTLDSDMQKLLAEQPIEAARKILSNRSGAKELNTTMANEKTAAGQGVNQEQTEVITQKQLESKIPLHPRQNSHYETTTEGDDQLAGKEKSNDTTSESPQVRRGSYDTITQDQLASIKDGYLTRWNDFPEVITEKQWDEMSRSVDGILPEDWTSEITQAQLINLRDNHRWEDPEVITQGQLDEQGKTMPHGGDTSRWKAASADVNTLVKTAAAAVTSAIANYGLSPKDILAAISVFASTPQSQMKTAYLTLINAIPGKIAARASERSRRRYFEGKIASSGLSVKPIDAMLAAMADNIGYLKAENFVDAVRRVVASKTAFAKAEADALSKIASSSDESANVSDVEAAFESALSSFGTHKIAGNIKTDIGIDPAKGSDFTAAVFAFASKKIGGKVILASVDADADAGTFEAVVKDCAVCSKEEIAAFAAAEKEGFKAANIANFGDKAAPQYGKKDNKEKNEDNEEKEEKKSCGKKCACGNCASTRVASRNEMVKEAQMMGGQMPTNMGAGGGQGASMPPAPGMGAGDPVQSFGDDAGAGMDDVGSGDADLQPAPPGSYCPVCTSEDVDVVAGKGKCNNCTSEFVYKISIDVTKWAGLTGDSEGGDEGPLGAEGGEGEGIALPEPGDEAGGGMEESLPVAAATLLKPEALKKMASAKVQLGQVSPYTGTTRTSYLGIEDGANKFYCHATGMPYFVRTAQKGEQLFAQWEWQDRFVEPCQNCRRNKTAFKKALAQIGETEETFHKMNRRARGAAVLKMANSGSLKEIKTASKNGTVLDEYKKVLAFVPEGSFPTESCREVLSRKWGEDAIALSGPDEGSNLVDSVCKRLAKASIYSDHLAIKIAEVWSEKDGCVNCLVDHIRAGFDADQSALICQAMKYKYAQSVEMLADELGAIPMDDGAGEDTGVVDVSDPAAGGLDGGMDDVDPFAPDAAQQGFVSVEIPMDVLEKLDQAFDQALGINPADEAHHDSGALPTGDATLQMPMDAVQQIEEVVDPALNTAVETGEVPAETGEVDTADETAFEEEVVDDGSSKEDGSDSASDEGGSPFADVAEDGGDNKPDDDNGGSDDSDGNPFAEKSEEKKESSNSTRKVVAKTNGDALFMNSLNRSKIAGTGRVTNLNLDAVAALIRKQAGESGLTQTNVQDDSDVKPYGGDGGSAMGHEEGFRAAEPVVPSKGSGSTMGKESTDLMPTDNTEIPAGGGEMGHEKEQGYTAEKGHEFTGGVNGAGSSKAASRAHQSMYTRSMTDDLASRLIRVASEKKVKAPAPWKEDSDIGTVSDNKDHSNTPEKMKITPFEEKDKVSVPEAGSGAFMGHEEESIGAVPKSTEHHPSIPAGGGKSGKYDKNEKNDPEKQDHVKGTVIAGGNEESLTARKSAAEKLAGKMIERGIITADQISSKIAELSRYEIEQIRDYEKALFGAAGKKGLDTVAKGLQTPLVVNASKNQKQDAASELKDKLQGLFSLTARNALAENDPVAQLRRQR